MLSRKFNSATDGEFDKEVEFLNLYPSVREMKIRKNSVRPNEFKILILNSSPEMSALVEIAAKMLGASVYTSNCAKSAIDLMKRNQFNLLILDHALPMEGGESIIDTLDRSLDKVKTEGLADFVPAVLFSNQISAEGLMHSERIYIFDQWQNTMQMSDLSQSLKSLLLRFG